MRVCKKPRAVHVDEFESHFDHRAGNLTANSTEHIIVQAIFDA